MDLLAIVAAVTTTIAIGNGTAEIPGPDGMVEVKNRESVIFKSLNEDQKTLAIFGRTSNPSMLDSTAAMPSAQEWATVKVVDDRPLTAAHFKARREVIAKTMEGSLDKRRTNDRIPQLLAAVDIKPFGMSELGIIEKNDRYITHVTIIRTTGTASEALPYKAIVMVVTFMSVHHRLVTLSYRRPLGSTKDIEIARARALDWAKDVAKASW